MEFPAWSPIMPQRILLAAATACFLVCLPTLADQPNDGKTPPKEISRPNQYEHGDIVISPATADEPGAATLSLVKADEHLQQAAAAWTGSRKCVSCHTNGTYLYIRPELSQTFGKPDSDIRQFFVQQLEKLQNTPAKRLQSGTRPAQAIYIAAGLAQWDRYVSGTLSSKTQEALSLMFEMQIESGTWNSLDCWPPFESSEFQEATMAAMAIHAAPGWLQDLEDEQAAEGVYRLIRYLQESDAPHEYGEVLRLWASLRLPYIRSHEQQQQTIDLLCQHQHEDGGWSMRDFATPEQWGGGNRANKLRSESEFETPDSDGHMTGLAVIVLQEAGNTPDLRERIERGLQWIRTNQKASGRWWARSLNTDKSHFITYSATAYSLLALQRDIQQGFHSSRNDMASPALDID